MKSHQNVACSRHDITETLLILALSYNHSLLNSFWADLKFFIWVKIEMLHFLWTSRQRN